MSFLDTQQILYTHQYGFRPKHSTIHLIIHLLNKCAEMTNSQPKQYTCMMSVFCNLHVSKAFDVIDHKILLAKLEYYGFRGIVKKWLADYLSNRTQQLYITTNTEVNQLYKWTCASKLSLNASKIKYIIFRSNT